MEKSSLRANHQTQVQVLAISLVPKQNITQKRLSNASHALHHLNEVQKQCHQKVGKKYLKPKKEEVLFVENCPHQSRTHLDP